MKEISDFPNQIDIMEISYQLHKDGLKKEIIDFWINLGKNRPFVWNILKRQVNNEGRVGKGKEN